MNIKPSSAIMENYEEIAELCRSTKQPVYLTKDGEGDLVVMDVASFVRREEMIRLREELLSVEEDRANGIKGCSPDELEADILGIIDEVAHGKDATV